MSSPTPAPLPSSRLAQLANLSPRRTCRWPRRDVLDRNAFSFLMFLLVGYLLLGVPQVETLWLDLPFGIYNDGEEGRLLFARRRVVPLLPDGLAGGLSSRSGHQSVRQRTGPPSGGPLRPRPDGPPRARGSRRPSLASARLVVGGMLLLAAASRF